MGNPVNFFGMSERSYRRSLIGHKNTFCHLPNNRLLPFFVASEEVESIASLRQACGIFSKFVMDVRLFRGLSAAPRQLCLR
jgi:hypothetical protein